MKAGDFFPSKYLKAEDFDADVEYTVKIVKGEPLKDNKTGLDEMKPVMYFEGEEKGLILNKTNWRMMEKLTSEPDSDKWNGHRVTLTIVEVDAFGDIVQAIRIKESKPSDPMVQKYWGKCNSLGITRQEGLEHLKEYKGDFKAALASLSVEETE